LHLDLFSVKLGVINWSTTFCMWCRSSCFMKLWMNTLWSYMKMNLRSLGLDGSTRLITHTNWLGVSASQKEVLSTYAAQTW
jgi:hypothetical protein